MPATPTPEGTAGDKWFLTAARLSHVFLFHRCPDGGGPPIAKTPMSHRPTAEPDETDFIHSEEFLRGLMRRQLRLSIACAGAFLLLLFGLPLANYFAPGLMARRVGGFTLSWLVLGVLFFPYVWIIAKWFIVRSIALEADVVSRAASAKSDSH